MGRFVMLPSLDGFTKARPASEFSLKFGSLVTNRESHFRHGSPQ